MHCLQSGKKRMPRKKRIVWTTRAQRDLIESRAFLRATSPEAAKAFTSKIRESLNKLRHLPAMGTPNHFAPLPGEYRSIIVGQHRVVYRVDLQQIVIYRIWDCRRDPAKMWDV
jgi:plasmid stabilization system protein ParE